MIEANGNYFMIHLENEGWEGLYKSWLSGSVAQIQMFDGGGWEYQSNSSSDFADELKDARIWFTFSFCWRGVWEGRIYFKDDEYWSEEMKTIPMIWEQIEVVLKNKIKLDNPDYKHYD